MAFAGLGARALAALWAAGGLAARHAEPQGSPGEAAQGVPPQPRAQDGEPAGGVREPASEGDHHAHVRSLQISSILMMYIHIYI